MPKFKIEFESLSIISTALYEVELDAPDEDAAKEIIKNYGKNMPPEVQKVADVVSSSIVINRLKQIIRS